MKSLMTRLQGALITLVLLGFSQLSVAQDVIKNSEEIPDIDVLIVHSYAQEYPWTRGQHQGFVERLDTLSDYHFRDHVEYLDTKNRVADSRYLQQYSALIDIKYEGQKLDLIYVTDDDAYGFAREFLRPLYPQVPIFFSGVNDRSTLSILPELNATGVFETKSLRGNAELIKEFLPKAKQAWFVGDGSITYQAIAEDLQRYQNGDSQPLEFVEAANAQVEPLLLQLKQHPDWPILISTVGSMRNAKGEAVLFNDLLSQLSATGEHMIYTMEDTYMLPMVHAGLVTSSKRQGQAAASLVQQWLSNHTLSELAPLMQEANELLVNEQLLYSDKIDIPQTVFRNARIVYPEPDFIDRYHSELLSLTVVMCSLLLFGVLVFILNMNEPG